jgi:hypothetical protein
LEKKGANLGQAAEIYGKTGIGFKESIYRTWKAKYSVNLI